MSGEMRTEGEFRLRQVSGTTPPFRVHGAYRNRRATSVHVCAELAISKDDTPCLTTDLGQPGYYGAQYRNRRAMSVPQSVQHKIN